MKQLNFLLVGFLIFSLFGFGYNQLNNSENSHSYYGNTKDKNFKIYIPLIQYMKNLNIAYKEDKSDNVNKNNTGYEKSWYNKVMENIRKDEYSIIYNKEYNTYQSPNRKNNLRFIYYNDGFTVKPRTTKIPLFDVNDKSIRDEDKKYKILRDWKINFSLKSYGRGNENTIFKGTELKVNGNNAIIEDDNMKITYLNEEKGMRQDFILKERPKGDGNIISFEFKIDTKLKTEITENEILFFNKKNERILKYNGLNVTDANGIRINAYFKKQGKKEYNIIVEDENAVYPVTIDPLSSTPNWTAESNQANAYFGCSVSTAGDVNGDGYSDIIVGANEYDNGQTNEGRTYVYYGSSSGLSSTANWSAESNYGNAYFACSVSTAGDVNGDGYSDIIIGADHYNTNEGKVFVYHGSSSGLSSTVNWTVESNQSGAFFGCSVSTAGDVNGDGYSDVIIGAYSYDNGQSNEGRAFVYYGSSAGLSLTSNWTAESNQANAYFGHGVSTAGDVNGDGYSDIIVGADQYSNGQSYEGRTFVFHGSSTGLSSTINWSAESNQSNAYFGNSVSSVGDVNGDGYSDVIVGAYNYSNGQNYEGRAYVYYGSSTGLLSTANWTAESEQVSAYFGCSVSTAGDVNGDGYSDVIVGAYNYDNGETNEGKVFVYHGSASGLSSSINWTMESNQASANFGNSVSTAGDINGDGYSDVIVGAYLYDNGQTNEGMVSVYIGSSSGFSTNPNWTAESNQANAWFGVIATTAGDVNGDGYSDVIVGAPYYDNGETNEGKVFVYHGSAAGLSSTANWTAEGNQANVEFAIVSNAGDVNGDGYSDVIIGAYLYDNGETNEGKVFVYHGSATGLSTTANWTAEGNQGNAYFGWSTSTAGDVNGDGYSDVIVSARDYDNGETDEGRVFVFHGSVTGLSLTANWTAEGNQLSSHFGYSVSAAGDVNGDGYSDVIIGAPDYDNGQINEGAAFVYYGSSSGLSSTVNWITEGNQADSYYGYPVSMADDINGDGYSDIIIAAIYYDSGETNEGKVFVYYGSVSGPPSTANWTAESNQSNAEFGRSISTAGDVNCDGYSDVIIGAIFYDNEGKVFVYYGSASGLSSTANWTAKYNQAGANFGRSVSTAGDVNGDGYSDVIIGAQYYDNGQTDEGMVFVYYGNEGTGLRSTLQQYKPGTTNIIGPNGLTGTFGETRLNLFGKSPFGRADGKLVYEIKQENQPFSGNPITNSTSYTGSGNFTDLGTAITGVQLNQDISGIALFHEYKWRVRLQYNPVNNPYQKFGPWKYYTNYQSKTAGGFKTNSMLIPQAPVLIAPSNNSTGIILTPLLDWNESPTATSYRIQISTDSLFGTTVLDTSSVTVSQITVPSGKLTETKKYFWRVNASNSNGTGQWSTVWNFTTLQPNLALNLKVYLEGFWNGTSLVSDTVKIYLANSSLPYSFADSQKVALSSSGMASVVFTKTSSGSYYIVIKHRNHLETWSGLPQSIVTGTPLSYNFTIAQNKAYGNNMIYSNGAWCIYGGDINYDGFVDGADMAILDNDLYNYVSGYVLADINGDQFVDGADMAILDNNLYNYIGVIRPGGKDVLKSNKETRRQSNSPRRMIR